MKTTTSFEKITEVKERVKIIQGGTSAGKTYAILQLLIKIAAESKATMVISVVSESLPHLKRGAMRDFMKILNDDGIYREAAHNKSDNYYKIGNSTIEFFSVDQPEKVRGGRRDILFINECNNVNLEAYNQLEVRTKRLVFLDYNPEFEFWVHEEVMKMNDARRIILTYKDNEHLDESIIQSIEKRKPVYKDGELISGNPMWWRVYGEGQTGRFDGVVFSSFETVDKVAPHAKFKCYGLDFGYSNDPAALISVWEGEKGVVILDELIYEKGLTNLYMAPDQKATSLVGLFEGLQVVKMGSEQTELIVADSAEPKSIAEIYNANYDIRPAKKGPDSIKHGIDLMISRKIQITRRSTNLIKEFRRYSWDKDKAGKMLNKPIDDWNHGIDAARYAISAVFSGEWERGREVEKRIEYYDLGNREEEVETFNQFGAF